MESLKWTEVEGVPLYKPLLLLGVDLLLEGLLGLSFCPMSAVTILASSVL